MPCLAWNDAQLKVFRGLGLGNQVLTPPRLTVWAETKLSSLVTLHRMIKIATIPSIMSFLRQSQGRPARLKILGAHYFRPGQQRSIDGKMMVTD